MKRRSSTSDVGMTQKRPRRGMRKMRMLRPVKDRRYEFVASQSLATIVGAVGGATQFFGGQFSFSGIPNASNYTTLFDAYRIKKIELKFVQGYNNNPTAPGSVSQPVIYIVTDRDDGSTPVSVSSIIERQNSRILSLSGAKSVHKHTFVPCVASLDLSTSSSNIPTSIREAPWLDSGFQNVAHFGVKYAVDNLLQFAQINVYAKYTFEMRNTL